MCAMQLNMLYFLGNLCTMHLEMLVVFEICFHDALKHAISTRNFVYGARKSAVIPRNFV